MAEDGVISDEIIEFEIGRDPITAHLIHEMCLAEGLRVALRLMDDDGHTPVGGALMPHRLSVVESDLEAAREIVNRWIPPDG